MKLVLYLLVLYLNICYKVIILHNYCVHADEVSYKGRVKGKVHMSKKPVKLKYGAAPVVGICVSFYNEKGLIMRVVSDLTSPI